MRPTRSGASSRGSNCASLFCRVAPLVAYLFIYVFLDLSCPDASHRARPARSATRKQQRSGSAGASAPAASTSAAPPTDGWFSFSFPDVPIGSPPIPETPVVPPWTDESALYLDHRAATEAASARFFTSPTAGRDDSALFDKDLVMQFLALYGHFLRVQRPVRETALWHTGEYKDRRHTLPFITGDAFRMLADFYCDNERQCKELPLVMNNASHPVWSRLRPDQSVIVFTTCKDQHVLFDAPVPLLESGFNFTMVIVVHNGDESLDASHSHYVDSPRVRAYFTQNCAMAAPHSKIVCVPIGIEPRQFSMHGWRPEPLMGAMLASLNAPTPLEVLSSRRAQRLAFAAWSVGTYKRERGPLLEMIEEGGAHHAEGHVDGEPKPLPNPEKPVPSDFPPGPYSFVTIGGGGQLEHYYRHVTNHAVVLSPRGNGLDTLRAWEALYLGRVVITKNSTLDAVFEHFPVHIVHDWRELTEDLVRSVVKRFSSPEGRAKISTVKLFMFYWACEVGRAAKRAEEFCSLAALEETLRRPEFE